MSEPSSQPQPGLPLIPKYELLEEIGHGGMATVYRARDPRLSRDVAVKVIHRHLRENTEVATRFVAEARAAAKLRHPGIVEVYDVSNEEDSERFLVVELLRGCTLRKLLLTHRDMPAEIGACMVRELCDAIEHAHESGIIHRDIKPENVLVELPADRAAVSAKSEPPPSSGEPTDLDARAPMVSEIVTSDPSDTQQSVRDVAIPKGTHNDVKPRASKPRSVPDSAKKKLSDPGVVIKITDFGIAKILDAQGMTSTGQVLGSPAHMAPEQIEGGDVDARTDVFALGVLMYECLVGHLPFEGKNPAQVLRKVLEGIYAPVDRERPTTGGRWSRIIAAALARDAADRTASPAALAEIIATELAALGITDGRAEINAYFLDPKGYAEAHVDKLVPKLLARGEAARKAGDIPNAAADFNRALALRPNDLAILKRVGGLATTANRRVLLKRATAVVGGALVAGLAAFGIARFAKSSTADTNHGQLDPDDEESSETNPEPDTSNGPNAANPLNTGLSTLPPPPTSSARHGRTAAHPVLVAPATASAVVDPSTKKVRINVYPAGANFFLDGKAENWAGTDFNLKPGSHSLKATIEDACCESPREMSVTVVPDKPEQSFAIRLKIKDGTVEVAGPEGATVKCAHFNGVMPFTRKISMPDTMVKDTCNYASRDGADHRSQTVKIYAGKTTRIQF